MTNRDVVGDGTWGAVWSHDFWGGPIRADACVLHAWAKRGAACLPLLVCVLLHGCMNPQPWLMDTQVVRLRCCHASGAAISPHPAVWLPTTCSYRPLVTLTFKAQYLLHGSLHAPAFHCVNILLHVAVCLLTAALVVHVFRRTRPTARAATAMDRVGMVATTAVFAAHPLHTEVVANVTGRAETMASACVLAGLVLYLRAVGGRGTAFPRSAATRVTGGVHPAAVDTDAGAAAGVNGGTNDGGHGHDAVVCPDAAPTSWSGVTVALLCGAVGVLCKETALVAGPLMVATDVVLVTARARRPPCEQCGWPFRRGVWLRWCVVAAATLALFVARVVVLTGGYVLRY